MKTEIQDIRKAELRNQMIDKSENEITKYWKPKDSRIPLLSIVCLAYNHEKYIARALDGFLMQRTDFPFEIIVHDDASTDLTPKIIKKYENRFPNIIHPVYEKENQFSKKDGALSRIINQKIKGKYTAYCEGDDYWIKEDKLKKQVDFLEANPLYSGTYHSVYYVKCGKVIAGNSLAMYDRDVTAEEIIAGGGEFCATASLCLRSKYLYEKWNFKEISDVGDYPLQIILGLRGKVRYMSMIAACYRTGNEGSWSSQMLWNHKAQARHNKTEIKSMLELNQETEQRYEKSIYFHIAQNYLALWGMGYNCRHDFFLAAKKSGFYYQKRLIRIRYTEMAKTKFRWLYRCYYCIQYEFLPIIRTKILKHKYENI